MFPGYSFSSRAELTWINPVQEKISNGVLT